MKSHKAFFLAVVLLSAGCGQQAPPAAPQTAARKTSSLPSVVTETPPPPTPVAPAPPGPAGAGQRTPAGELAAPVAPASTAIDFATATRPVDRSGRAMSDLEWLNQIVMGYFMTATMADAALPKGPFRDSDEEMAARTAAIKKKQESAAVRELSDLVKAGVIKAIPAAPPGQKYVLDPKSHQVLLVAQ